MWLVVWLFIFVLTSSFPIISTEVIDFFGKPLKLPKFLHGDELNLYKFNRNEFPAVCIALNKVRGFHR